jgi:pilus assembly protein CpaF
VLQTYVDDPTVEEIWINAPDRVFIARGGRSERVALTLTDEGVRDLVERMLHTTGRRVDLSQPFVDASLPDGSRLHVVIPDTGGDPYPSGANRAGEEKAHAASFM